MTPEITFISEHQHELVAFLSFLSTLPTLAMAFSTAVRMQIGKRDHWTCQEPGCNRSFTEGWMVHAAHNPAHHSKDDPLYDTPEGGDIRCIEHHLAQHEHGTSLGRKADNWAASKLRETPLRTRGWLEKHERGS